MATTETTPAERSGPPATRSDRRRRGGAAGRRRADRGGARRALVARSAAARGGSRARRFGPSSPAISSPPTRAGTARRWSSRCVVLEDGASREPARRRPVASASEPAGSSTNVQEQGVDEPDLVKSDGTHIFAIAGERLEAVDAAGPTTVGSLRLPAGPGPGAYSSGHELLLAGDSLLVISNAYLSRAPWTRTVLTEVDVSDPAAMRAVRTMTVDGGYVSARLSGGTIRVVTSTTPSAGGRARSRSPGCAIAPPAPPPARR